MCVELAEKLSIESGCVHWDKRDWGWGGSFRERPPTSMQFTFMFGLSPARWGGGWNTDQYHFNNHQYQLILVSCVSLLQNFL